jgi:hypothetical protein
MMAYSRLSSIASSAFLLISLTYAGGKDAVRIEGFSQGGRSTRDKGDPLELRGKS